MKRLWKGLFAVLLIAALLSALPVLAGAEAGPEPDPRLGVTDISHKNGNLSYSGVADAVETVYVAWYNEAGQMIGLREAALENGQWSVDGVDDGAEAVRFFGVDEAGTPAVEDLCSQRALVVDGERYWTLEEAREAAGPDGEITLDGSYNGMERDDETTEFCVRRVVKEPLTHMVEHTDGARYSNRWFTQHVTVYCDTEYLDGEDWGGLLTFENCHFAGGLTIRAAEGVHFGVDFSRSCLGDVQVTNPEGWNGPRPDYEARVHLSRVGGLSIFTRTYTHLSELEGQSFVLDTEWGKLSFDGSEADTNAYEIDVRWDGWYDETGYWQCEPCVEINADEPEMDRAPVVISTPESTVKDNRYNGTLRIAGTLDLRGLEMKEDGQGHIETSFQRWSNRFDLGGNVLNINPDCGGLYDLSAEPGALVFVQSGAWVRVKDRNFGQPHIFGREGDGVYLPLTSADGLRFDLSQAHWDEETQNVNWFVSRPIDPEDFEVLLLDENGDGAPDKLHLEPKEGVDRDRWIDDPNNVSLQIWMETGAEEDIGVVFQPVRWKPVQLDEFVRLINEALGTDYQMSDFGYDWNGDLDYRAVRVMLGAIWEEIGDGDDLPMWDLVDDENYWAEYDRWSEGHEDWDEGPDAWTLDWYQAPELLRRFCKALPQREDSQTTEIVLRRVNDGSGAENTDGRTYSSLIFTQPVTVVCDASHLNGDDWGGALNFVNCEFKAGLTVKGLRDAGFDLNFNDSCIADLLIDSPAGVSGPEGYELDEDGNFHRRVVLRGIGGMTVDARTYTYIEDVEDRSFALHTPWGELFFNGEDAHNYYSVDLRWDGWREENGTQRFEPCVQVETGEPGDGLQPIVIASELYDGKLRVGGYVDVRAVQLNDGNTPASRIESAGCRERNGILLGGNRFHVNDDWGEYNFSVTEGAKISAVGSNANLTVNGRDLGWVHIFGRDEYGVYLALTDVSDVEFQVWQRQWNDEEQYAEWPEQPITPNAYQAVIIDEDGDGQPDKTHLERLDSAPWDAWITDPWNVALQVRLEGARVTYERVQWKPVQVQEFTDLLCERLNWNYWPGYFELEDGNLTNGAVVTIFTKLWEQFGSGEVPMKDILDNDWYWEELERWNQGHEDWDWGPNGWTVDWFYAEDLLRRFCEAAGFGSREVHTAQEFLDAVNGPVEDITVAGDITVTGTDLWLSLVNTTLDIPEGSSLTIGQGVTLSVGDSAWVNVGGTLDCSAGALQLGWEIAVYGSGTVRTGDAEHFVITNPETGFVTVEAWFCDDGSWETYAIVTGEAMQSQYLQAHLMVTDESQLIAAIETTQVPLVDGPVASVSAIAIPGFATVTLTESAQTAHGLLIFGTLHLQRDVKVTVSNYVNVGAIELEPGAALNYEIFGVGNPPVYVD